MDFSGYQKNHRNYDHTNKNFFLGKIKDEMSKPNNEFDDEDD
jgi:hypothetical protein